MKCFALLYFLFLTLFSFAQDSVRKIEPNKTTSFNNYSLLIMAVAGLVLLVVLRFWIKRKREQQRQ